MPQTETQPATAFMKTDLPPVEKSLSALSPISPRKRPDVMQGSTYKVTTAYGNLYVTINEDEYGPFEVFSQLGKAGGFFGAQTEAICRMISLALRSGIRSEKIIDQLKGIRGPDPVFHNGSRILSLPDAIANVLENHLKRGQTELDLRFPKTVKEPAVVKEELVFQTVTQEVMNSGAALVTQKISIADTGHAPACPECGNMLTMAEGCMKCEMCGYSKCG
jgi:ribonucleoside-diphosphate reductase alpha chain